MSNTTPYTMMIADDHQLFVDGLVRIFEQEPDFKITGVCNSGEHLLHLFNSQVPDLVLLDIHMKNLEQSGIDICINLKEKHPDVKVIFISMFESFPVIAKARQAGANGFIHKSTDSDQVKATIREIMNGTDLFPKSGREQTGDPGIESVTGIHMLSKREKEIIQFLISGHTAKAIAGELYLSEYTVETHRRNILRKLGLNSVVELIAFCYRNNLS